MFLRLNIYTCFLSFHFVSVCIYAHMTMGAQGNQKGAPDPLELEMQKL